MAELIVNSYYSPTDSRRRTMSSVGVGEANFDLLATAIKRVFVAALEDEREYYCYVNRVFVH